MAIELHLARGDVRFRPTSLCQAQTAHSDLDEPPAKRIKLETGPEPARLIELWNVAVVIDLDNELPSSLRSASVVRMDTLACHRTAQISTSRVQVGLSAELAMSAPIISIKQQPTDGAHQALLYMLTMTESNATVKSIRQVYNHVQYERYLELENTSLRFVCKLGASPLLQWSPRSIGLQRNRMFSFFSNLMFPDMDDGEPPTVAGFYKALKPPPKAPDNFTCRSALIQTQLMDYQRNAVHWMTQRENGAGQAINLWRSQTGSDGSKIYVQRLLGLVTDSEADTHNGSHLPGGLLADEMGLGKSLAIIALAVHNPRHQSEAVSKIDRFTGNLVKPINSTLIVAPAPILRQWIEEVHKHSSLKVCHYNGMAKRGEAEIKFEEYDIVVTSYHILANELHHAAPVSSERKLRNPSSEKRKCPLVMHEWHRVVMDEAQMISSGSSAAAQVACQIPRQNAWIVTGTPIAKSCFDTFGLLHFLRIDPIYANQSFYNKLLESPEAAEIIDKLFEPLSCRNTKALVAAEMALPKQTTFLCPVEFTSIEGSNFNDLIDSALDDLLLVPGMQTASDEEWKQALTSRQIALLQSWLVRFRQAATHPYIGSKNKHMSHISSKPLQTLSEVLEIMTETNERQLEVDMRAKAAAVLQKGQILEYQKKVDEALSLWQGLLPELQREVQKARERSESLGASKAEGNDDQAVERALKASIADLRFWRELLQRCYFFIGSAYFVMKEEAKETEAYAKAKQIRKELLSESEIEAATLVMRLAARAQKRDFAVIPEMRYSDFTGGFSSRLLLERLQTITEILNEQANLMDEWREMCVQRLVSDLADQNDDATGEEYQESLDKQAEASDYHDLLRIATADRQALVIGVSNTMIENDIRLLQSSNTTSSIVKDGLAARAKLVPRGGYQQWDSLASVLGAFKATVRQLEHDVNPNTFSGQSELAIAKKALLQLQKRNKPQKDCCEALSAEFDAIVETLNNRLLYYKQLQAISDGLTAFTVLKHAKDDNLLDTDLDNALGRGKVFELEETDITDEERAERVKRALNKVDSEIALQESNVNRGQTRAKYMAYLNASRDKTKETCTICLNDFDRGAMTLCGHIFCRDCFSEWFRQHRACPLCKKLLDAKSFHSITLSARHSKPPVSQDSDEPSVVQRTTGFSHYESLTAEQSDLINAVKLVRSYSSKIDTIVKHIISLPSDSKAILYSNWQEVLAFFSKSLDENGVRSTLLGEKQRKGKQPGLEEFMNEPNCKVLLMSGKSQSAGLTLVNARYAFLVEPLLNTAVERQIVSRIHRIGQTQETSVFQYAVQNTMEMTILQENARLREVQTSDEGQLSDPTTAAAQSSATIVHAGQYEHRLRTGETTSEDEAIALFRSNLELSTQNGAPRETLIGSI